MRKIIKRYGDTFVITFSPDDMKSYDLKVGDVVDISDIVVLTKPEDLEGVE